MEKHQKQVGGSIGCRVCVWPIAYTVLFERDWFQLRRFVTVPPHFLQQSAKTTNGPRNFSVDGGLVPFSIIDHMPCCRLLSPYVLTQVLKQMATKRWRWLARRVFLIDQEYRLEGPKQF